MLIQFVGKEIYHEKALPVERICKQSFLYETLGTVLPTLHSEAHYMRHNPPVNICEIWNTEIYKNGATVLTNQERVPADVPKIV